MRLGAHQILVHAPVHVPIQNILVVFGCLSLMESRQRGSVYGALALALACQVLVAISRQSAHRSSPASCCCQCCAAVAQAPMLQQQGLNRQIPC